MVKKRTDKSENRRHSRLEVEADVIIQSQELGFIPGRTVDFSEGGLAAVLPVELKVGESVMLDIEFPSWTMNTRAIVRNRSVFRHGFEFEMPLVRIPSNILPADACETCHGSGYVHKAQQKVKGAAFVQVICKDCKGTGTGARESG
jgi:hypothetical protein